MDEYAAHSMVLKLANVRNTRSHKLVTKYTGTETFTVLKVCQHDKTWCTYCCSVITDSLVTESKDTAGNAVTAVVSLLIV